MSPIEIGVAMIIATVALILMGVYIGVVLAVVGLVGVWAIVGNFVIATKMLAITASDTLANYFFGVIPLFVLMGLIVDVSGIGRDTFDVAQFILGKLRGGLAIATVAANAVFAAVTGVSVASAALFARIAIPEMMRKGYNPKFAAGAVAGSSVLGMLIPPSLLMIVYGILSDTSIGDLFLAGIGPGILLSLAIALSIYCMALFWPRFLGRVSHGGDAYSTEGSDRDREETYLSAVLKLLPSVVLITVVLGGIYGGIVTTTEAAGLGAAGALAIAVVLRRLKWREFWQVLLETGQISVSILFLVLGASAFSKMLTLSGLTQGILEWVQASGFNDITFLMVYVLILLGLGMLMDSVSILLIVVPMVLSTAQAFQFDLVWFGIVTILAVEIGLITPPFGLSVYVIESTLRDDRLQLHAIFVGAAPFILVILATLALVIAFPEISLMLVRR